MVVGKKQEVEVNDNSSTGLQHSTLFGLSS